MKTTSDGFKALAEDEYGVKYYHKITLNGTEITEDINDFKYSHTCNGEDTLTIGNVGSAMIKFSINRPSINLANEEIEVFEGIDVNGTIEYVKLGIFKVLKPINDRGNTTYQCVDRMTYLMNMPFFSELTDNVTDVAILNEICTQVGITLANTDLTSHALPSAPIGYTRREVISYMSQLQGKNAIINNEGNLELIWYSQTDYVVDDDKIYYEGTDSINGEMDYILEYIECIVRKEEEEVSLKSGNGIVGIIFENPFMTQEILDEVFARIGGFTYRPVEVQFLGDFRLEVGDIVTVTTNNSSYIVPIMELTHDSDGGVKTTIQSIAETESENGLDLSSPNTKAMDRYYANLVLINKALVNKLDVDQLDAVAAEIQRLVVNEIDGKYAEIDFANIDTAKVDKNIVSLLLAEVGLIDRATIVEGHITGFLDSVEVNANKITAGTLIADRILLSGNNKGILYALNNLGELTSKSVDTLDGYVLTERTITADKIVVNSITAKEIDVEDLFAQDITATGTIRGAKFVGGNLKSENFVMQGSDVVSGMEIDLVNGYIWSPNVKILRDKMEISKIKKLSMLISKEYEYIHNTYGTIKRNFAFNIENDIDSIIYLIDSIVSDNELLAYTTIGSGYLNISNKNGGSLFYDEDGLLVQGKLTVTGATTLESTLDVKGNTIIGDSDATTYKGCYVQNSYRYGGLHASESGNLGLIDFGNNRWLIYQDSNGANYIPSRTLVTGYIKNTGGNIIIGTNNNFLYGVSTAGSEYQLIGLNSSNQCGVAPTLANVVIGKAATNISLGSASTKTSTNGELYAALLSTNHIEIGTGSLAYIDFHYTSSDDYNVRLQNDTSGVLSVKGHFAPSATNTYSCGTSGKLWSTVYAKTSAINTSDRKEKDDIVYLQDEYDILFDELKPVSYKFIDGTSGRTHIGFISNDIEESLTNNGMTALDFAGFCKDAKQKKVIVKEVEYDEEGNVISDQIVEYVDEVDEDGNVIYDYALRYSEFIALNTNQIQKLKTRVNILEEENAEIKAENAELKATLGNVLERLTALENK